MNTFGRKRISVRYSGMGMALLVSTLTFTPQASVAKMVQMQETTSQLALFSTPDATETVYYFVVSLNDGSVLSIPFAERPVLTCQGTDLLLTTTKMEMELPQGSVKEFTLEKKNEVTGVEETLLQGEMQRQGDNFLFSNCKEGTLIQVFDRSGRLVATQRVDANGQCRISLHGQPNGIYIVKSESITCKILKK